MIFKHTNTTDSIQYFVFHSEPNEDGICSSVIVMDLESTSAVTSGQPHHHQFETREEAEEYAIPLGYEVPENPDLDLDSIETEE